MNELDSQILEGIREVLSLTNNPYTTVIDRIRSLPATYTPSRKRGSSIYPRFEVRVSEKEADAIYEALKNAETKYGYSKTFAKRQINLLINDWNRMRNK